MKENSFQPGGQFPISSRRQFDIVRTHRACLWEQILRKIKKKKRKKNTENGGKAAAQTWQWVGGRRAELGGPGGARPSPIMAWHLESEPAKCQTGYDRNGDRQIMTDPWPQSSERSQLTQPPVSWCAFRSRKKVSEPVGKRAGEGSSPGASVVKLTETVGRGPFGRTQRTRDTSNGQWNGWNVALHNSATTIKVASFTLIKR